MATLTNSAHTETMRRVVLIDFDWQDADLLPRLLRQPGLSVRLVAGERPDDPGLRVAELCGLPRTLDLADLTREIFDLALVSERSARRTQIEGLLLALGTPCASPRGLLEGDSGRIRTHARDRGAAGAARRGVRIRARRRGLQCDRRAGAARSLR